MMLVSLLVLTASPKPMPAMNHPPVSCPAAPVQLPAALQGWEQRHSVLAGATPAEAAALPLGAAVTATLRPATKVGYVVRPSKPGGPASNGGIFTFTASTAGRYRVALGEGAWIDVLSGTEPATSVAHAHGPDCTGVRKMVDFDLKPGRYSLQIADSASTTLPMMVVRLP